MSTIRLKNLMIAPMGDDPTRWYEGELWISGNRLIDPATVQGAPDQTIDLAGCLAVPGLVNTHHHLYQTLTRGVVAAQNAELFEWLTTQYPIWAGLDAEMVYYSAVCGLSELALSGCTTVSDMFYVFPHGSDVVLDAVIRAAADVGIRMHAGRGAMSLGQSAGGLPPDSVVQDEDAIMADVARVVGLYHDRADGAMTRIDLMPCSPFSVTGRLMAEMRDYARANGLRLHTHLAETLDEERFCLEKFGVRPLKLLEDLDWLGSDVWLAHGIHFDDAEVALLGRTRTGIAHCPSSNMRLGSGICRTRELIAAGAPVGLAVDGSSSNDGGSLLAEARQALLLGRMRYGVSYSAHQALAMATGGGAAVLGRSDIGRIAPGLMADLAIYDMTDVAYAGTVVHDPVAALTLNQTTRARYVFANGRAIVADGRLTGLDLGAAVRHHNVLAKKLVDKHAAIGAR
jgi:cytosine/adenosine deaminase-related metal-dependent hydrolase